MSLDAAVELSQKVGLPVVLLGAGAFLLWRLGGHLLRALVDSYNARIGALEKDRDHFRERSEAADDRTNGLCRDMIDELRRSAKGAGHGDADPDVRSD